MKGNKYIFVMENVLSIPFLYTVVGTTDGVIERQRDRRVGGGR